MQVEIVSAGESPLKLLLLFMNRQPDAVKRSAVFIAL